MHKITLHKAKKNYVLRDFSLLSPHPEGVQGDIGNAQHTSVGWSVGPSICQFVGRYHCDSVGRCDGVDVQHNQILTL